MKNLILATASVLALSVAGAGIVHAADTGAPGARTQAPGTVATGTSRDTGQSVGKPDQAGAAEA